VPAQTLLKKEPQDFRHPDGSLNNLNFETLLVPDPNCPIESYSVKHIAPKLHYWIED